MHLATTPTGTCHPNGATLSLFSRANTLSTVLDAALAIERVPLALMRPEERPGIYVLFARHETPALRRYGNEIVAGTFPIYIGSAQMLPNRLNRHRKTLVSARGLDVDDFYVGVVYTDSLAMALAVEEILIKELRPPWNERTMSGFGSAPPGAGRLAQKVSGFDCLHRRDWANKPTSQELASARKSLRTYRASGYARALWSAL